MGRGKIEIKKIENSTNRQVTFAKRRAGLMKKAQELTVLCDAEILLILLSSSNSRNRGFHYCSPKTNIKEMIDRYQEAASVDLWSGPYEKMQKELEDLMDTNSNLRKEIRQRMGEELDDLDFKELEALAEDLEVTARVVREKKYSKLGTQLNTKNKKVGCADKTNKVLKNALLHAKRLKELQNLGYVVDDEGELYKAAVGFGNDAAVGFGNGAAIDPEDYKSAVGFANGEALAFRLQPNQPNLHEMEYGLHELRLA